MGVDIVRIGDGIRRLFVISIRLCYREVCRHPILVGMVCFWIFLYRSFPLLFSLLVSASPVLVCTAVLLGTLLCFGEPNVPEIENENEGEQAEVSHELAPMISGVVGDSSFVVGRDESFYVDRFTRKREDKVEKSDVEHSLVEDKVSKIEDDDGFGEFMPVVNESSRGIQFEKSVVDEAEKGSVDLEKKKRIQEEISRVKEILEQGILMANECSLVENEGDHNLEGANDTFTAEYTQVRRENGLDFLPDSSWKRANDDDADADADIEDGGLSDSGSDGVESSSPDASMSDILPMLDELHPLLDEEAPQPAHRSHDGSDAGSPRSDKSKEINFDSDGDMEKHADEDDEDDDNDHEEESHGGKEDESKSAITWTEDDQKNLLDLGTSELERNQRLESLIARRRARRSFRLMSEKNLIDLDGADLPINVPYISTKRHNPFDFPYDDDAPGSAPSVLLPRRNPFDLPYDSSEEKPDLKGDSFQREFSSSQHKEPFFRRHESFSIGPSAFGGFRHERQESRWKPYFVPERFANDGTSYPSFQRQLSEASESKLSSLPDTESVSSAVEDDDRKLNEEDTSQEAELISNVDHASLLVERGSLTSEDVGYMDVEKVEESDVHHGEDGTTLSDIENHHVLDRSLSGLGGTTPIEFNTTEILLRMEAGEEDRSSRSSISSLSDADAKMSDMNKEWTILGQTNSLIEESLHTNHVEEHSLRKEDSSQFELDHVLPLGADTKRGADLHHDTDVNAVSSGSNYRSMPLEESSPYELEKQQSWSDKIMVEPDFDNHDNHSSEPTKTPELSVEEMSLSKNIDMTEAYDTNDDMPRNISSLISESLEHKSLVGLKDNLTDRIVCEDSAHAIEHLNYSAEAHNSPPTERNVNDEEDEIKEIDEQLLTELDTVGDFNVKVVNEPFHDEQVPEHSIGSPKFDSLPNDSSLMEEVMPELPLLEVRSGEDTDIAFKHIPEGTDIEAATNMTEDQIIVDESEDSRERNSGTQVGEPSSFEDIGDAVKQVSLEIMADLSEQSVSEDVPAEENEMDFAKELPVPEGKTIDEHYGGLKQLHQGADAEETILPSTSEQQVIVNESKSQNPGHTDLDLPIIEERSPDGNLFSIEQLSQSNGGESLKPLGPMDNSLEGNEVVSPREIEVRTMDEVSSSNNIESSTSEVVGMIPIKESGSSTEESGENEKRKVDSS